MNDYFNKSPADVYRHLRHIIYTQNFSVDIQLDIAWIFLKKPGFEIIHFGDALYRHKYLGKWIATFTHDMLLTEVIRLFPLIDNNMIKLAKFTNLCNQFKKPAVIVVYCLNQDIGILETLKTFGWDLRWKYNFQTFKEKQWNNPK